MYVYALLFLFSKIKPYNLLGLLITGIHYSSHIYFLYVEGMKEILKFYGIWFLFLIVLKSLVTYAWISPLVQRLRLSLMIYRFKVRIMVLAWDFLYWRIITWHVSAALPCSLSLFSPVLFSEDIPCTLVITGQGIVSVFLYVTYSNFFHYMALTCKL